MEATKQHRDDLSTSAMERRDRRPLSIEIPRVWMYCQEDRPPILFVPFRISSRCSHVGKHIAATKRKIVWRFGLEGMDGRLENGIYGQEFEVELTWSLMSGKWSLLWNNTDITSVVKETKRGNTSKSKKAPSMIELKWRCMDMCFRIVAHSNSPPSTGDISNLRQYDFFADGESFSSLPGVPEILRKQRVAFMGEGFELQQNTTNGLVECFRTDNRNPVNVFDEENMQQPITTPAGDFDRPVMIDDSASSNSSSDDNLIEKDELHSSLHESKLDKLRAEMRKTVPQADDLISRGILNALFHDSETSCSSSSGGMTRGNSLDDSMSELGEPEPIEMEATALLETLDWLRYNADDFYNEQDAQERKLHFMQKQVDRMICQVKDNRLNAMEASGIMRTIAAVLGMELTTPMPRNTIVLSGLDETNTSLDIETAMLKFGAVEDAGIANAGCYGICRFESSSTVDSVLKAASQHQLVINGEEPQCYELMDVVSEIYLSAETSKLDPMGSFEEESIGSFEEVVRRRQATPPQQQQAGMRIPPCNHTKNLSPATECTEATELSLNSDDLNYLSVAVFARE